MRRLYNAAALAAVAVMLTQAAQAQEIGLVTLKPDVATGEMRADIPARPDGETVYIMRDGERVATASITSSGQPGGAVLSMPAGDATRVRVGDRISLSPDLTKAEQLPLSAYEPVDPSRPMAERGTIDRVPPSLSSVVRTEETRTETRTSAQPPPSLRGTPAPPSAARGPRDITDSPVSAKGESFDRRGGPMAGGMPPVAPVNPRLTPRGSDIRMYPAPAIVSEAGVLGPYAPGLAAAAPVGTPFLRSPAFAGPPVIYMPQTVNRVLLPSVTPYPANVMQPPVRYPYASAPFTRTDIYVNLPYGTYYWPNGYAGTTPVEPQIPVYVTAPATAVLTSEAAYTTQRYAPGAAHAEALNPITVPPVVRSGHSVESRVVPQVRVGETATSFASGPAAPPPGAAGASFGPEISGMEGIPGGQVTGQAPSTSVLPPLEPLSPFPNVGASGPPEPSALSPESALPPLPPLSSTREMGVPALPPTNTTLPALTTIDPPAPLMPAPGEPGFVPPPLVPGPAAENGVE